MQVTLLIAILGVLGTLGAQIIANVFANRRENKRQLHERELKRMELSDKKLEGLREERLRAYIGLADMTKTVNADEPYEMGDLAGAVSAIELLANFEATIALGNSLSDPAFRTRRRAWEVKSIGSDPAEDQTFSDLFEVAMEHKASFIELAKEDLAI